VYLCVCFFLIHIPIVIFDRQRVKGVDENFLQLSFCSLRDGHSIFIEHILLRIYAWL